MENLLVALLSFTLLASTSAVRIIGGSTPTIARGSGARMGVLENPAAPVLSGENLQDCLSRALDASPRKHIALLGSTGSIGTQTLDICREYPEAFEVISISAGANVELLAQQAIEFKPKVVGLAAAEKEAQLRELISAAGAPMPEIVTGPDGQIAAAVAPGADTVVTGVVGVAGLFPTIEAKIVILSFAIGPMASVAMPSQERLDLPLVIDQCFRLRSHCRQSGKTQQQNQRKAYPSAGTCFQTEAAQRGVFHYQCVVKLD